MRILLLTTIGLLLISCSERTERLINNTEIKLKATKYVSYQIENLTIEGQSVGDTIFTSTYAHFEKSATDTLIGYNFLIESSLIHPRFLIPVAFKDHYNGKELTWTFESQVSNEKKITEFKEINKSVIENKIKGHLPLILNLLNKNGYKQTSEKEIELKGKKCIQLNFHSPDSIEHQFFVDKNEKLPVLLRIVFNKEQPYIQEYYYKDFHFSDTTKFPITTAFSVENSVENSEAILPIKIGDTFPNWELTTISGLPFNSNEQKKKNRLIILSGIHCGACREQIPTTKKIYELYSKREDINLDIFGIYPYDTKERLNTYTQEKKIDYPIAYNSLTNVKERWELIQKLRFPIPTLILINSNNEVTWINSGFNSDFAEQYLNELAIQIKKISP